MCKNAEHRLHDLYEVAVAFDCPLEGDGHPLCRGGGVAGYFKVGKKNEIVSNIRESVKVTMCEGISDWPYLFNKLYDFLDLLRFLFLFSVDENFVRPLEFCVQIQPANQCRKFYRIEFDQ